MSGAVASAADSPLLDRLGDEAHLWLLRLRESIPAAVERRWHELLSPEEEAVHRRFRVAVARRQHLAARALVRTTLSRYADVDPRRWAFSSGPEGKPKIAGPDGAPPLRFNLSHTRGLVACVVTLGLDAGVDVERPARRLRDPLELARHGFAPAEREMLGRLSGRARRDLFCDLWTLKEAYVKARGVGLLSLPARKLAYEIGPDGLIGLTLEPELGDRAEEWQLALLAPTDDHRLAVAIRRGRRPDLELVTREIAPQSTESRRVRPAVLGRSAAPRVAAATVAESRPNG
ncbi:MAG: 4'-phosphopantetheinyl transferase family protein [Thermoanaerobaculia bacterium]